MSSSAAMHKFSFTIGEDSIPYYLGNQCFSQIADEFLAIGKAQEFDRLFIVCDENIKKYHLKALQDALDEKNISHFVVETCSGETNKSLTTLEHIAKSVLSNGCSRRSIIVPMGGGIVGNMSGLTAALLFRGIRFVHLPTTFLSAHDSVTSKKQAVNCNGTKNILGTYYVPTAIMCNVSVFDTLTQDSVRSGSGELVKNAVLFGGEHFDVIAPILKRCQESPDHLLDYSEQEILQLMSLGIKAKGSLLKDDPKERTTAIIFEYGHTVGHALELTYGVSHGCAVALGLLAASFMSNKMGLMSDEDRAAHDHLVLSLGVTLPLAPTPELRELVFKRVQRDNKRGYIPYKEGFYPLILAIRIGEMHKPNPYYLEYVPENILLEGIDYVMSSQYRPSQEEAKDEELFHQRRVARPWFLGRFVGASLLAGWLSQMFNFNIAPVA